MINNKLRKRIYIGTEFEEVAEVPNLISIQLDSYKKLLQEGIDPDKRDESYGLESVFKSIFPIEDANTGYILDYKGYTLGNDKNDIHLNPKLCKEKGLTYSAPLKATITLDDANTHTRQEKEMFFCYLPLMTDKGSFIINGTERVVVSQIHRSPGVIAQYEKGVYSSRIIPSRGSWLEFEIDDKHDGVYAKIDRKKRILATIFLRSLGFLNTREDIMKAFYDSKILTLDHDINLADVNTYYAFKNYFDSDGVKIVRAGDSLNPAIIERFNSSGIKEIEVVDFDSQNMLQYDTILKCFEQEEKYIKRESGEDEPSLQTVIHEVFQGVLRSEMMESERAQEELKNMFFNPRYYNLGEVGKYKFNAKFYPGDNNPRALEGTTIRVEDMVETIKYLINVFHGKEQIDDIDHLGNRRVRCVGEMIENHLKGAFYKLEKSIREKLALPGDKEKIKIQNLISDRLITASVKDFFASSQLSQFMDQVNPLSALTHKRRITALGPGGLNRERASFEVRDVHYTHYGRMCPIETPEGQNIGLVITLANYTKITEYGFLETPYRKVVNGKATKEVRYMDAVEEEHYYIAQSTSPLNDDGSFQEAEVSVRKKGDYSKQKPEDVAYMDVSPRQMISIAASLIPFLEHDDANRALMGSNMQRQAVPLLFPEAPRVGTGMEANAAYDSGVLVKAERAGEVSYVSSTRIEITPTSSKNENDKDIYYLNKMVRTNQETCFNQHPIVSKGDKVEKGQVIADGPATDKGELALGRNILVAFMPWRGYNYEDAVLISERVVKEDIYTSVHITELSIEVKETKFGPETITRDIPNTSADQLSSLDADGLIKVGTYVKSGDILVGRVTPKNENEELSNEYKLLNLIFGKKAEDVKDTSLRVPHGTEGTVINIQRLEKTTSELAPGVEEEIRVFIANKRKLRPGDKMAGRHGNKGVVSRVLPVEDMPYMADGTPIDVCLNPLGVPSRMNIGQLMETQLGWAAVELDQWYNSPVFQSASMEQIEKKMEEAGLPKTSKQTLYDGRTGEKFVNDVFCGYIYYLKLNHLVEDKMHARSTGPYSLIIQQPLGGRAKFGGQRFGEMEVWALEAYGAANTLQEILTIKSDDIKGRYDAFESIVKGKPIPPFGTPEAFNVLMHEIRGLGFDLQVFDDNGKQIAITERDQELLDRNKR